MTDGAFHPEKQPGLGRCLATALLIGLCFTLTSPFSQAQGPSSARLGTHPAAQRPGVIDSSRPVGGKPVYTIVGAVQRSGAYESTESSLLLHQLVEAAGGLTSNANPVLRVVRAGQLRFQVYYDAQQPSPENRLLPGDIIIAVSAPETTQPATVPVACLGLMDWPVVLPLDPSIQTIQELSARLLQSPEVVRNARVISPTGEFQTRLVAGSVILFPPAMIDRLPLQQPGALPPLLELKPKSEPTAVQPAAPSAVSHDVPAATQVSANLPVQSPPVQRSTSTVAPMSLQAPALEDPAVATPLLELGPVPDLPVPTIQAQTPVQPAAESPAVSDRDVPLAYDSGAPAQHQSTAPYLAGAAQAVVTSSLSTLNGVRENTGLIFTESVNPLFETRPPSNSELTGPLRTAVVPGHWGAREVMTLSPDSAFTLDQTNTIQPVAGIGSASAEPGALPVQSALKPARKSRSLASVVLGITLFLSGAIGIAFYLAQRRLPGEESAEDETSASAERAAAATTQDAGTQTAPVSHSGNVAVEEILQRKLTMVEVPVDVPGHWPLQGHAIGHRRLIVNTAHPTVAGPHFPVSAASKRSSRSSTSAQADERKLRQELRSAVASLRIDQPDESFTAPASSERASIPARPQTVPVPPVMTGTADDPQAALHTGTIPVPHIVVSAPLAHAEPDSQEYDIVEPELSFPTAKSPLERALRTLASEKRG